MNLLKRYVLLGVGLGVAIGISLSFSPTVDASRNGSGTYSLPAGNPVVTGTSISSTWANNTLSDIAAEITKSLDRTGGTMTGQLKLASGSSSAPSFAWSSETNSGMFRNGSNDIQMQVNAVTLQKWSATTATFPLAVAITGNATTAAGITATQSTSNGSAITATGNGTGPGVTATGGTTGAGGSFANGTAATGGTRRNAVTLTNGDLSLDGVADSTHTTSVKNALTPSNIIKSWGKLTTNGATPVFDAAFNVTSASCATNNVTVNVAQDFATANYVVMAGSGDFGSTWCNAAIVNAGSFQIECRYHDGTQINLCGVTAILNFIAIGVQ